MEIKNKFRFSFLFWNKKNVEKFENIMNYRKRDGKIYLTTLKTINNFGAHESYDVHLYI